MDNDVFDQMIAQYEAEFSKKKDLEFKFAGVNIKISPEKQDDALWVGLFQKGQLVPAMQQLLGQEQWNKVSMSLINKESNVLSTLDILKFWQAFGKANDDLGK